jgi:hypothetical protein
MHDPNEFYAAESLRSQIRALSSEPSRHLHNPKVNYDNYNSPHYGQLCYECAYVYLFLGDGTVLTLVTFNVS